MGSGRGRVCETEPSAAPKVLLIQRKGSFMLHITVTFKKTHAIKNLRTSYKKENSVCEYLEGKHPLLLNLNP